MSFKIKRIELQNFINFNDFEIEFNDGVTRLIGANGSGKTTIGLTAILTAFKGIAERAKEGQITGARYQFIGTNGKTADVILTIVDTAQNNAEITVSNHITHASNAIEFKATEGYNLDQEKFSSILSLAFMSAKNFTSLSGKEQAISLGINTSEYDSKIKDIKEEYTFINREFRNLGELIPVEKTEKISITELLEKKKVIDNYNKEQEALRLKLDNSRTDFRALKKQEAELLEKLGLIQNKIKEQILVMSKMEKDSPLKSTNEIDSKIENAEEINKKALAYEAYLAKKNERETIQSKIDKNRVDLTTTEEEKLNYIKSFKMPFNNLSVDDDGQLLLKGRLIKSEYFSKGELEVIVAKLHLAMNPDFKVRFIDDFELLDEDNQKDLLLKLTEAGFQVLTAEVGKIKKGINSFLLKESKLVDSYD